MEWGNVLAPGEAQRRIIRLSESKKSVWHEFPVKGFYHDRHVEGYVNICIEELVSGDSHLFKSFLVNLGGEPFVFCSEKDSAGKEYSARWGDYSPTYRIIRKGDTFVADEYPFTFEVTCMGAWYGRAVPGYGTSPDGSVGIQQPALYFDAVEFELTVALTGRKHIR